MHFFALLKFVNNVIYLCITHSQIIILLDHDLDFLELEETKGPSAFTNSLNNTHNANQTILDILGARLADDR